MESVVEPPRPARRDGARSRLSTASPRPTRPTRRFLLAVAAAAQDARSTGLCTQAAEIDVASVFGAGFPAATGGALTWLAAHPSA